MASSPVGIACGATCSADFTLGNKVTLTATPDEGAEFTGWSGGGCTGTTPSCTVAADVATTVSATFDLARYPVTIDMGGLGTGAVVAAAGISCPGSCTGMVEYGSQLSLVASPASCSLFMGWTVGPGGTACTGTGACETTITGPTKITATFTLHQTLEVTKSGTGAGTVTSSLAGIDCGADCSETYPPGTTVTLTATPAEGSTFAGWRGGGCSGTGPCTVDVNDATLVTADFQIRTYSLFVLKHGSGAGSVTGSPGGVFCSGSCSKSYAYGTVVTLTATPVQYHIFGGWDGGGCSGTGTCTVRMTGDITVGADFQYPHYRVSVSKVGGDLGFVISESVGPTQGSIWCGSSCSMAAGGGTQVTLTAVPFDGAVFAGWSGGGCTNTAADYGGTLTVGRCTFVTAADTAITAIFRPAGLSYP